MADIVRQNTGLGGGMVLYGRHDGTDEYKPVRLDNRGAVEMVNPRLSEQMEAVCAELKKVNEKLDKLISLQPKTAVETR